MKSHRRGKKSLRLYHILISKPGHKKCCWFLNLTLQKVLIHKRLSVLFSIFFSSWLHPDNQYLFSEAHCCSQMVPLWEANPSASGKLVPTCRQQQQCGYFTPQTHLHSPFIAPACRAYLANTAAACQGRFIPGVWPTSVCIYISKGEGLVVGKRKVMAIPVLLQMHQDDGTD